MQVEAAVGSRSSVIRYRLSKWAFDANIIRVSWVRSTDVIYRRAFCVPSALRRGSHSIL